jgi:hypothetical protein
MQLTQKGYKLALLGLLSAAAWADVIKDPRMEMDEGAYSDPIHVGTTFTANADGAGTFGFYNPTGRFIVALGFQTFLKPGLDFGNDPVQPLDAVFQCNDAADPFRPSTFFGSCTFAYDSTDGALDIRFFDPLPRRNSDGFLLGFGLPPLPVRCEDTPDTERCLNSGHFGILLYDPPDTPGGPPPTTGGWANPLLFPDGPAQFTVTEVATTPEPSTLVLLGGALVFIGRSAIKRRRR